MKVVTILAVAGVMLGSAWADAADSLSGKYTGNIMRRNGSQGATLVINSAQDGLIKGTATRKAALATSL